MPEKETLMRARKDAREGKSATTQAGEFVREEMEHIRQGKHGASSAKQAIAIGLSKARRAGVPLPPPKKGKTTEETRSKAARDYARGQQSKQEPPSPARSRAAKRALKRKGSQAASPIALARQARAAAMSRSAGSRAESSRKAVKTKGKAGLQAAATKAARTRKARAPRVGP